VLNHIYKQQFSKRKWKKNVKQMLFLSKKIIKIPSGCRKNTFTKTPSKP